MNTLVDFSKSTWLKDKPSEWMVYRVKNFFDLSKEKNEGEDLPVLSLTQQGIRLRDISANEGQLAESYDNYTRVRKSDIVFNPMDLRAGYVGLSDCDGVISLAYTIIRKKRKVDLNLKYYSYFFQWHYLQKIFFPFGQGVSIDHRWTLKDNILLNFPLLVPPLETQEKIANFLDNKLTVINKLLVEKQKLIELLLEKRISLITRLISKGLNSNVKMKKSSTNWFGNIPEGWKIKPLKQLASFFLSNVDKHSIEGQTPVRLCNYTDVYKNEYIMNDLDFMLASASDEQISRFSLKTDDILITKDSEVPEDIAVPAFVSKTLPGIVCGYHLAIVRPKADVYGGYLFRAFQSSCVKAQYSRLANGITRYGLSKYSIGNVLFCQPPHDEQKDIARFLNCEILKIDNSIKSIRKQIKKITEYRSSVIHAVVTGKVKVY